MDGLPGLCGFYLGDQFGEHLQGIPYDFSRVMNAGFAIDVHGALPAGKPLRLKANLESVDDNGKRAILTQKLITGTDDAPEALSALVNAYIPLKRDKKGRKKERPIVPGPAREIGRIKLSKKSGLDFALLTGDFNPIHWVTPYARMMGFKSTIAHGFSIAARAIESLNRVVWSGQVHRLKRFECRFVRPLTLPSTVGFYLHGEGEIYGGDAPGGPAYLVGSFEERREE